MRYVMAVDPSLTCSGWAIFDISSNSLQAVGKIKSLSASGHSLPERYEDLQRQVSQLFLHFNLGNSDVVICESETTMIDPKAAFKVERVRGIFETLGRERGCIVPGRISPRTVQFEVMGLRGKQLQRSIVKQSALQTVQSLYADSLRAFGLSVIKSHQDIIDAILLGHLATSRLKSALTTGVSIESCFI
jgi:Holliday junction resolvasome RuvABC endonuclease subunit